MQINQISEVKTERVIANVLKQEIKKTSNRLGKSKCADYVDKGSIGIR